MENISESPESLSKAVLQNIRSLVRDKTRFEQDEVESLAEEEINQKFMVCVSHKLDAIVISEHITGFFLKDDNSNKYEVKNPKHAADGQQADRLITAATQLKVALAKSETTYNFVKPGLLLPYAIKYWKLDICRKCDGNGKETCGCCKGCGRDTCPNCSGAGTVGCTNYRCLNGRALCYACDGRGQINERVSYQEPYTVYTSNGSRTEYRVAYKTIYKNCTEYGCIYGRVQCKICFGDGELDCLRCSTTGEVTCSPCVGSGQVTCSPCAGSGQTGLASWVDVSVSQYYALQLPENIDSDTQSAVEKEGEHKLPAISESFGFNSAVINGDPPKFVNAQYDGCFNLIKIKVACGGKEFNLSAYGTDLRWLHLDGILEHLLNQDLTKLENVLIESLTEGVFSLRVDHLLESVKYVVASELNADLLDLDLFKINQDVLKIPISNEFIQRMKKSILGASGQIYTRLAKQFWWKVALATVGMSVIGWAIFDSIIGFIFGALTIFIGWLLFRRNTNNVIVKQMAEANHGKWLINIVKKTNQEGVPYFV